MYISLTCFYVVQMYAVQRPVPQPARTAAAQADVSQGGAGLGDGAAGRRHETSRHHAEAQLAGDPPLPDHVTAGQLVRRSVRHPDCRNRQRQEPRCLQPRRPGSLQRALPRTS